MFKKLLSTKKGKADSDSPAPVVVPNGVHYAVPALHEAALHADAHDEGGLSCNNDELLKQQREAIMEWIKSMGKSLLKGNINLINTPFPVVMFEPRSYLEKLADVWVYPRYLSQAASCSSPVERMKLVVTWFVAGLHHGFEKWKKPFNPILGETWQACLSDGSTMFMEQISHHPPVSAFHMEGPGGAYRFMGLSQPNVSVVVKQYGFKTVAKGFRYVEFADGSQVEIHYPVYFIKGVVYSSRPRAEVDGKAVFVDRRNCLQAHVNFGAVKGGRYPYQRRTDAITGGIYDTRNSMDKQLVETPRAVDNPSSSSTTEDGREGSDEFESASETEWDPREGAEALQQEATSSGAPGAGNRTSPTGTSSDSPPPSTYQIAPALQRVAGPTASTSEPGVPRYSADGGGTSKSTSLFSGITKALGLSTSGSLAVPAEEEVPGTLLASIEGSWLSHLNIDNTRYWTLATEARDMWQPMEAALPSDSRYRHDLAVLRQGDVKGAQVWKEKLEEMQRKDKKRREGLL